MLAIICFMGGPIVNKIGVKWALIIGSMSFPIQGSAYYCNSKFGNQWVSDPLYSRQCTYLIYICIAVPHPERCHQWYWNWLLVCR
jgi:hypothetical protein